MHDDRHAILADFLDRGLAAHDHRTAPGVVRRENAVLAEHDAAGGKIRSRHVVLDDLVDGDVRVIDVGAAGVDHLAQIVRRDVGRHADGDAARAVDQKIGESGRQDLGFLDGFVVVRLEIDGSLVDVVEQRMRDLGQARFGVAHGRRAIAVHRAEVALAVDERQAHREILGHAHHGVVDRRVAVRVVFAHDVADDARRLAERLVEVVAAFLHRKENAPMHRLQAVAHVGQRAADDHAHRVIEIRTPHLVFDGDRLRVETGAFRQGRIRGHGQ